MGKIFPCSRPHTNLKHCFKFPYEGFGNEEQPFVAPTENMGVTDDCYTNTGRTQTQPERIILSVIRIPAREASKLIGGDDASRGQLVVSVPQS